MKNSFLTLLSILILTSHVGISQSLTVNTLPPSCPTCCDGSWTLTIVNCSGTRTIDIVGPNLHQNYTNNFGDFILSKNACCGQYTISVFGDAACANAQLSSNFTVPCNITGLEVQNMEPASTVIFPNPFTEKCYLEIEGLKSIEITDPLGKFVQKITTDTNEIDLSGLKVGLYYISIYSDKGKLLGRQKVIKN